MSFGPDLGYPPPDPPFKTSVFYKVQSSANNLHILSFDPFWWDLYDEDDDVSQKVVSAIIKGIMMLTMMMMMITVMMKSKTTMLLGKKRKWLEAKFGGNDRGFHLGANNTNINTNIDRNHQKY